ncbi:MAG: riboflavin biosynthesis protein RibD [Crenarchaeota archaeon 13_1_20CM_2_51_8]|nr:MAG: riboflavin biosynthesis protein RibD [Crenarchaeota archaeon 13_1_20CM_2_51_8]
MRKIVALSFVTLDGVMQAPGGPDEDTSAGFKHGGWSVGYWDGVMGEVMSEQMGHPYDLLLGRKTYEIFAAYWPRAKDVPGADGLNRARKYVVSRTLKKLGWSNSVLLTGNVPEGVMKLKRQEGPELQVHGSSNLIQTLLRHDLVDEFRLKIFPVTIGHGKRLFGDGTVPASFKLLESKTSTTGVVVATYRRDGEIKIGSFDLATQTRESNPAEK